MTGYTRKDTTNNIADGNIINADDLDNEFDGVQAAFHASTGHTHDGTAAEGAAITKVGPVQDVLITTTAIYPKTTNTVDLGTSSLKYKDAFIAGNETVGGTLAVTGVATLTAKPILSSLTASSAVATDASKGLVSVTNTGTGNNVLSTSATLITPALGTPTSLVGTNITGVATNFTASNVTTNANLTGAVTSVGNATSLGSFTSLQLATALTDETGSGANVFATSPTLVTPALGTPSALVGTNITGTATNFTASNVTTNANLTGAVTSVGNAASLGSFTSLQLATALTDETGSGANVFATSPTLVTPALGTPSALIGTNITGTATNFTASNVTTNANLTGAITSVGNAASLGSFTSLQLATALTDETGSGANVFANSPTLITPALGTPSSGVVTNLSGTASININGTVGATTPTTGSFTTVNAALSSGYTATTLNRPSIRPSLLLDFASTRVLDPRITFTRASTATFYDTNTSAVAEQNLVLYSQAIGDAGGWSKLNLVTTANSATAPDNTTTATLMADTNVGLAVVNITGVATTGRPSSTYTVTFYAKAGTANFIWVGAYPGTGGFAYTTFDISTGTVGANYAGSAITAVGSIISVGSGWYRCSVVLTGVVSYPAIGFTDVLTGFTVGVNNRPSYNATGTFNAYIWGAQLEQRSTATAYTATTTQPITNYIPVLQTAASGAARFDCNPVTRESLGLLIEESRTNLLTYSEQFDNAAWTKTNSSITANTVISPDGTLDGDKVVATTAGSNPFLSRAPGLTSGAVYSVSVFAKAAELQWLRLTNSTAVTSAAWFNLSSGTVGNVVGTGNSATITPIGNGWFRCVLNVASWTVGSGSELVIACTNGNGVTTGYTGDGYSGLYIWGAQVEAGAFATSYIPTIASQVTRAEDSAVMTGTNFSSWYNQNQGTIYSIAKCNAYVADSTLYAIDDGTTGQLNGLDVRYTTFGTAVRPRVRVNNVSEVDITLPIFTFGTQQQHAFAYKVNDFAASQSGGTVITDTVGTLPTSAMTRLRFGGRGVGSPVTQLYINRFAYYPSRISDTETQGVTT